MSDHPTNKSSVSIDVGATAKLNVGLSTEIPSAASGRFVDALTDLIRPWSEARGLKADGIRLQREDVAYEIAKRAAKRINLENNPRPIPLKILVPLLEKGSQENPSDDFMIEKWSNLLASAATTETAFPKFVSMLSELNGAQASLLDYIAFGKVQHDKPSKPQEWTLRSLLANLIQTSTKEVALSHIERLSQLNGRFYLSAGFWFADGSYHSISDARLNGLPKDEAEYALIESHLGVLCSLGLIEKIETRAGNEIGETSARGVSGLTQIWVFIYYVTALGHRFLQAVTKHDAT